MVIVVDIKETTEVGVIHEAKLADDTVCIVGFKRDGVRSRVGGSREEAIVVLFIQHCLYKLQLTPLVL